MLSNASEYGIRALIYLAAHKDRNTIPISEISDSLGISFHFLTKILQKLTRKKYLFSTRGPNGGISFVKKPSEITLIELINIIDNDSVFDQCVLGLPGCGTDAPCPMHDSWTLVKDKLKARFEKTTLLELAEKVKNRNERIS
jgi:Rrf2 family protein